MAETYTNGVWLVNEGGDFTPAVFELVTAVE